MWDLCHHLFCLLSISPTFPCIAVCAGICNKTDQDLPSWQDGVSSSGQPRVSPSQQVIIVHQPLLLVMTRSHVLSLVRGVCAAGSVWAHAVLQEVIFVIFMNQHTSTSIHYLYPSLPFPLSSLSPPSPSPPLYSFPPPFVTGHNSGQWLRDALAKAWSDWLPSDTLDTIKKCEHAQHS